MIWYKQCTLRDIFFDAFPNRKWFDVLGCLPGACTQQEQKWVIWNLMCTLRCFLYDRWMTRKDLRVKSINSASVFLENSWSFSQFVHLRQRQILRTVKSDVGQANHLRRRSGRSTSGRRPPCHHSLVKEIRRSAKIESCSLLRIRSRGSGTFSENHTKILWENTFFCQKSVIRQYSILI